VAPTTASSCGRSTSSTATRAGRRRHDRDVYPEAKTNETALAPVKLSPAAEAKKQ
jgi:hypothetical protein